MVAVVLKVPPGLPLLLLLPGEALVGDLGGLGVIIGLVAAGGKGEEVADDDMVSGGF